MARAWCLIREMPHYRREAFASGLSAAGFEVLCRDMHRAAIPFDEVRREDVLVIWNRYGSGDETAKHFEARGGRVVVAENGFVGRDAEGRQHYALALKGHNGSGVTPSGGPERWRALGIELKPWRADGGHVLVCPNRPFGPKGFAMPQEWAADVAARLRTVTRRKVRIRPHPGNHQVNPPKVPLADDLEGAWAVVVWASSAGVHALLAGIPVIREAPHWILAGADSRAIERVEAPPLPEREPAFERLAWAQWTVAELANGEAFRTLLACR